MLRNQCLLENQIPKPLGTDIDGSRGGPRLEAHSGCHALYAEGPNVAGLRRPSSQLLQRNRRLDRPCAVASPAATYHVGFHVVSPQQLSLVQPR